MRILGIGAHPDDFEINCGGTLARFHQRGHHVVMAFACSGDKGHFRIPPAELADIRKQEAQESAAVIQAESIWLGYHDGEIVGESIHGFCMCYQFFYEQTGYDTGGHRE